MKKKVGVISLGCDKNRVDTEKMLYKLQEEFDLTPQVEDAQIVVVNTCAFLNSARKEAIDEVINLNELRKFGKLEKVVMTGCLPQKFVGELFDALTEVDVFLGISDYEKIVDAIKLSYKGVRVNCVGNIKREGLTNRVRTTNNYAYLKIADGCNNHCTYCLIPSIRGKYRSTPLERLVEETKNIGKVSELILVAQDVTKYGVDIGVTIVDLIKELSKLETVEKIRLLYCYPESITEQLIEEIKTNDKVIKYLDIPFQHADDKILKLMNRKGTGQGYKDLIFKLRKEIPSIAIRSTFIAGFPFEGEEEFNNLLSFIKEVKLTNAGFFEYSKEKGTPSYKLKNHNLASVKKARVKKLYKAQKENSNEFLSGLLDKEIEVTVDGFNGVCYEGRAYFSAPDIDGKVYLTGLLDIEYGKTYKAVVKSYEDYDLYAEVVIKEEN